MRSCGGCTACCTSLGVTELGKAAGERCAHESGGGCAIYGGRPQSCRDYLCVWLADPGEDLFRNMERPDRVGVLVDPTSPDSRFSKLTGMRVVAAREIRDRAFGEDPAIAMLNRIARKFLVMRLHFDGRRSFLGPKEAVAKAQQLAGRFKVAS